MGEALQRLMADPSQPKQWLMRASTWNPAVSSEHEVRFSSHGYVVPPDGTGEPHGVPDFAHFPAGLKTPFASKLNLLSGGRWNPSAVPGFSNIVIANPIGHDRGGDFDALVALAWRRRPIEMWVGPWHWMGPTFADFERVFSGVVDDLEWDTGTITVLVHDLRERLKVAVNPDTFLGYGTALRWTGVGVEDVVVPHHADLDPAQLRFGLMVEEPTLKNCVLGSKGGAGGYEFRLLADGSVLMAVGGLDGNRLLSPTGVVAAGRPARVTFEGTSGGLRIYVDGALVAQNTTPYVAQLSGADLILGRAS